MLEIFSSSDAQIIARNLTQTSVDAGTSAGRLASGQRDIATGLDAASMAMGARFGLGAAGISTALTSANQASSILQIADGAMAKIEALLVRAKVLALASTNEIHGTTSRNVLEFEFQELLEEIDRIAKDTEFDGIRLLAAENTFFYPTTQDFIEDQNGVVNITARNFNNRPVADNGDGPFSFNISYSASGDTVTNSATFTDTDSSTYSVTSNMGIDTNDASTASVVFNGASDSLTYTDTSNYNTTNPDTSYTTDFNAPTNFSITVGASQIANTNNQLIFENTYDTNDFTVNPNSTIDGGYVFRFENGALTGTLTDRTVDEAEVFIVVDETFNLNAFNPAQYTSVDSGATVQPTAIVSTNQSYEDNFSIEEDDIGPQLLLDFKVGEGILPSRDVIEVEIRGMTIENLVLTNQTIDSVDHAEQAIELIDDALDFLLEARAVEGADASRVQSASASIINIIENRQAARSALLDVNVAKETTMFLAKKILLESGIAIMAQTDRYRRGLLDAML